MKIGIIIHSYTGNTLSVAQKLKEKLTASGHIVNLEQVTAVNGDPKEARNVVLKDIPDTKTYDVLIFGAPVWAFSLSPIMKLYLSQVPSLQGKKIGCFVTQQLRFKLLGGNNAINKMKKACQSKGGSVYETGIVNWSHKQREAMIEEVVDRFGRV
ncbi:MAG TPA: NAD(P)H-dependent oxidoreductase [Pseudobacteroides sp.]|uniref:flavodoxin family protein n=1 Tax=Pseudobacteroides sp. TaxID=1968840 RepID=UPI002F95022A